MKKFPIIVVDDDREDHLIMNDYFDMFALADKVKYFQNGSQGLSYLTGTEDKELPDLILLDLNMPIMNGTQMLIQVKRDPRLKDIPVIIYSTSENETEKRKCLSFGALDYVVKPSSYDAGFKMVQRFATLVKR
jgi:CheY-like chemotaxis protein